jgi:hypothetical protein
MINVELRDSLDEGGDLGTLSPPSSDVGPALPSVNDTRYPLLRLIDPYGETVFSSYQMRGLIPELEQRHRETGDAALSEILSLAEKLQGRRAFLVFMGD